jgi:hypothetical protein
VVASDQQKHPYASLAPFDTIFVANPPYSRFFQQPKCALLQMHVYALLLAFIDTNKEKKKPRPSLTVATFELQVVLETFLRNWRLLSLMMRKLFLRPLCRFHLLGKKP